jgi:hypothetical protein
MQVSKVDFIFAHKIEATIPKNGKLYLDALPFVMGDKVEIIILKQRTSISNEKMSLLLKLSIIQLTKQDANTIKIRK